MRRSREDDPPEAYWPGVADSLLAALMIVMLLAFGGLVLFAMNPNSTEAKLAQLQQMFSDLTARHTALLAEKEKLRIENDRLKKEQPPKEPPIIELTDAQNVNFESGKAQISDAFAERLREREFPRLRQIIDDNLTVDTIEIIGHTDDSPVGSSRSNLDGNLSQVVAGSQQVRVLSAGSNADLGLMRAVAVEEEWRRWLSDNQIVLPRQISVRCYSAANTIPPFGITNLPKKLRDEKARRIEIRFTQLRKAVPD